MYRLRTHNTYRRWGDKTSYLKNVKCSGEPKNMAALTLEWMGQPSIYHATVALSFQIEICNLDRTKSSFLATSLYKKVIFTKIELQGLVAPATICKYPLNTQQWYLKENFCINVPQM